MGAKKCNAPHLSRAALRRSARKIWIVFSESCKQPVSNVDYAAEALNHLSYS